MTIFIKVLIALAGLGFVLAVIAAITEPIMGTNAEGFSRGSSNLALIAIALSLAFKEESSAS